MGKKKAVKDCLGGLVAFMRHRRIIDDYSGVDADRIPLKA